MTYDPTAVVGTLIRHHPHARILVAGSPNWPDPQIVKQVLFVAWLALGQDDAAELVPIGQGGAAHIARRTWRELDLPIRPLPGVELAARIAKANPDVALVFVTSSDGEVRHRDGVVGRMCEDAGIITRWYAQEVTP